MHKDETITEKACKRLINKYRDYKISWPDYKTETNRVKAYLLIRQSNQPTHDKVGII